MKKTTAYLFAFIACMGLLWTCNKEEKPLIIKGKVTNSITGEPVEGASVYCSVSKPDIGVHGRDNSTNTDQNGDYFLSIPSGYAFAFSNVYKPGFLPKPHPGMGRVFDEGMENVLDLKLIPEDGFIRLILNNDHLSSDSVYVKFYSSIRQSQFLLGGEVTPKNNPNVVPFNGVYKEIVAFPAEEYIQVYWDTKAFAPAGAGTYHNSVYVSRYDTIDYTIHF